VPVVAADADTEAGAIERSAPALTASLLSMPPPPPPPPRPAQAAAAAPLSFALAATAGPAMRAVLEALSLGAAGGLEAAVGADEGAAAGADEGVAALAAAPLTQPLLARRAEPPSSRVAAASFGARRLRRAVRAQRRDEGRALALAAAAEAAAEAAAAASDGQARERRRRGSGAGASEAGGGMLRSFPPSFAAARAGGAPPMLVALPLPAHHPIFASLAGWPMASAAAAAPAPAAAAAAAAAASAGATPRVVGRGRAAALAAAAAPVPAAAAPGSFCGECGKRVATSFCKNCGAKA
jgi:hypothetical protein